MATAAHADGHYAFQSKEGLTNCRLGLAFSPQAVVVKTEQGHGECGFGQGVYADETYRRAPRVWDGEGREVRFKTTPPEQYNAGNL